MHISDLIRPAVLAMPSYEPGKPIEEVERELGIRGVIKLASNENPLGPSTEAMEAIAQSASKASLYPDANAFYLKEALSSAYGLTPDRFFVGNGLDEVLRIISQTFFAPGDEVLIPHPTFSVYESVTLIAGATPVKVAGKRGLGNDLEALAAAVTGRTKAVFVCNPNNPTGSFVGSSELTAFLSKLPGRVLVILDEAYADFADDPDFPQGLDLVRGGNERLLVLRTFSKIHGLAGLRLGFAAGSADFVAALHRMKDPFNVNILALAAGLAALGSAEHIRKSKELVREGRRRFYAEFAALGLRYLPSQANFVLVDLGRDSRPLYDYILRRGLITRPTHTFGLPTCLRVSIGTAEQNERFFELLREALTAGC